MHVIKTHMDIIKHFWQKNIIIIFLSLLLLGKSIFRWDWDTTIVYFTIFAVTMSYTIGMNMVMKNKMDIKNTFIITSILLVLIWWISIWKDLIILSIIALVILSLRYILRYKGSPIINIATLGWLIIILMGYIYSSGVFIGWWWASYNLTIWSYRLPYGTIISILACLSIIYLSKKYLYAVGFFVTYAVLWYFIFSMDFIEYNFLDGTLYFFFWVMALEPKTGIYGKYQMYYWILLWVILLLFFKFQIPWDYFLALAIMNALAIFDKHRMSKVIQGKIYPKWQQWLCIPCGYIYDPVFGDEDSGIVPGTEFVDIPDSWRCPVCGVTKSDFIPCEPWKMNIPSSPATIVEKTLLNQTTLELIIETQEVFKSMVGQFISFLWRDEEWEFSRSYSIVEQDGNRFKFTIKLTEFGRGAHMLEESAVGTNIRIKGVFGNFLLQNTLYPKIFIATGTGLAPIYNMILSLPETVQKSLYFSVGKWTELFYVEKLRAIPNLDLHIHTTQEEIEWYTFGRVDANNIDANIETEWYLCGNPKMVTETRSKLIEKGYKSVYSEEF